MTEAANYRPTKGPWSVTDNSWEVSSVYGFNGDLVAECRINSDADEDTQDEYEPIKEANARLIAAAPELLEASEKALIAWRRLSEFLPQNDRIEDAEFDEFMLLRSAVAKARGIHSWEVSASLAKSEGRS